MNTIIKTTDLACQSGRKYLINQINWQVEKGEHWIIFGLNGCGKTTLLSIVAGFKGQTEGELEVFGKNYTEDNIFSLRQKIGWVSSSFFDKYLSWESALSIVLSGVSGTLSMSRAITDNDVKRALALLRQLRLGKKIDQPFALMSKGERQCVLIARALVSQPEILILDEPSTGLDIYAREYILTAVDDLARHTDMTIIYVTHYIEEILPSFDKTMLMKDGQIYAQGVTSDMLSDDLFTSFLNYPVHISRDIDGYWQAKLAVEATFRNDSAFTSSQGGSING